MRTRIVLRTAAHVRAGFTIVELLVVVAIIGALVGVLMPAVNNARKQAKLTTSLSNLRQMATALASYSSEWNDRQLTLVPDSLASYGTTPNAAVAAYAIRDGDPDIKDWPSAIQLGWGSDYTGGTVEELWVLEFDDSNLGVQNRPRIAPMVFTPGAEDRGFGWFRIPNARQLSQYVNGRFYDPIFYAPKDTIVLDYVEPGLEAPDEYLKSGSRGMDLIPENRPGWSSYCLSPAGLFNPGVLSRNDPGDGNANGWRDPWSFGGGLRVPSMSQALYSDLKTQMLEHHWLQNGRDTCNGAFSAGPSFAHPYTCEPYYFNLSRNSSPATLFYDGHVSVVGGNDAVSADLRVQNQSGGQWGLWSRDTPFGEDGYFHELAPGGGGGGPGSSGLSGPGSGPGPGGGPSAAVGDGAGTAGSYHILTTDGIRGRDFLSD